MSMNGGNVSVFTFREVLYLYSIRVLTDKANAAF